MPEPFAFRTPIAIPEIGAEVGDAILYREDHPGFVQVVKRVPVAEAMGSLRELRELADVLPPDPAAEPPPIGARRLEVVR